MTQKVFLEGAELALHEAKERKRLRIEAENKAKEIEEAAMEDMMMGIEDYESEEEEQGSAATEGVCGGAMEASERAHTLKWVLWMVQCSYAGRSRSVWGSLQQSATQCSLRQSPRSNGTSMARCVAALGSM